MAGLIRSTLVVLCSAIFMLSALPSSLVGDDQSDKERHKSEKQIDRADVPPPDSSAVVAPQGYRVEVVVKDLTYATSVEFDDQGRMYIAEAGYSYGDPKAVPRLLLLTEDGSLRELSRDFNGPINDLLFYRGRLYVSHRGKISVFADGNVYDLVTELPSYGDHHNNQLTAGPDGKIYFGQGTATNSGVVGLDNYKMGWLQKRPEFHDVPAFDIVLEGRTFETPDPFSDKEGDKTTTSAFQPFGTAVESGAVVEGRTKASGTILRMNPDGSELEVYAWGLRNPYGVMWSKESVLYATENGFDARGSRPIANDNEDIYIIKRGAWYGWPDYAMGKPVTDEQFAPMDGSRPKFLMKQHPEVEQPWMSFPKHSAIAKLDVGPGGEFGHAGDLFVAFFGHMTPMTGTAGEHGGHRIVRIDPDTKEMETFFGAKGHRHGHQARTHAGKEHDDQHAHQQEEKSKQQETEHSHKTKSHKEHGEGKDESITAGPRRLTDVRFSPDGDALYVVDFGGMTVGKRPHPIPGTGVVWRVVPNKVQIEDIPTGVSALEATRSGSDRVPRRTK